MKITIKGGDLHQTVLTKSIDICKVWHLRCPKYVDWGDKE
jgi:hypothetical protein